MSGTFSSLGSALSALRYNRVAMDVASNNVANAGTTGYTRRQVVAQSTGAPALPAIWSRWDGAVGGVQAGSVTRMVDPILDARARTEHAGASFTDTRASSLENLETAVAEPGDTGVSAALDTYQAAWHDVANNPSDEAARTQLLASAQTLRDTIAAQGSAVSNEWASQRSALDAATAEVNQAAAQLADLNRGLQQSFVGGTDAGTLLDQRDQLTLRLAELTGAKVTVNPDTTVDVTIAGQDLVRGTSAATVTVTGSGDLAGSGADPVTVSVNGTAVTLGTGAMGAQQTLLTTDLPGYLSSLDGFVATLAATVNAQHQAGADLAGVAGGDFWSGSTAATLQVAITDPRKVAAADLTKVDPATGAGGLDNSNATVLAGLDIGGTQYRNLVSQLGVSVSSARQGATNQATLAAQVDASRETLSGVSTDEEMVNLLAAQHGYEAAARVMTALDSMLDTLINNTGMVGR
jgi:flagellar hook-associated protein 1 FlgK